MVSFYQKNPSEKIDNNFLCNNHKPRCGTTMNTLNGHENSQNSVDWH